MKKSLFVLWITLIFVACSDDDKKELALAPGTSLDYVVYADETSVTPAGGISFTAVAPWRATVSELQSDESQTSAEEYTGTWINVSPDYGDMAGDYTIQITLDKNLTGKDRKAVVAIECGETKVSITIEQKALTENGDIPGGGDASVIGLISELFFYFPQNIDRENSRFELTYDDQGRLVTWKEKSIDYDGSVNTETLTYQYGDKVVYISSDKNADYFVTAYLNDAGYVVRAEERRQGGEQEITTYLYDSENHLIRTEQSGEWEDYVWSDGNLIEIHYDNTQGESDKTEYTYYTNLENKENFDFSERTSWLEELMYAGLTGVQSRNLVRTETGSTESAWKDNGSWEYETDADGYVTKAKFSQPDETGTDNNPRTLEIKHFK